MEDSIQNAILISDSIYALVFRRAVEIGLISHLATSYFISKQTIHGLGKCFSSNSNQYLNQADSMYIHFSDNSIVMLNPETKMVTSTIYPPPTPTEVQQVFYCPSIQRMFLFLKTGSLCIYKIDKETGILEKIQDPKVFKDYEHKPLAQTISFIGTCRTEPPKYDCEILSDLHKYKEPAMPDYYFRGPRREVEAGLLDKFLVMGLSKGTIVFVRLDNLENIYARFSIHR